MHVRLLLLAFAVTGMTVGAIVARVGLPRFNSITQLVLAAVLVPVIWKCHRKIYIILKTLPRDVKFIYRYVNANRYLKNISRKNMTIVKVFREHTKKHPNKPCFIYDGKVWTYADVNKYSNQIASVFQKTGLKKGDAVALMMPNRPEYVATWVGLGKLGVVTALINTNLRLQSLLHCITVAKVKAIIYTEDYASAINDIADSLTGIVRYTHNDSTNGWGMTTTADGVHSLTDLLAQADTEEPTVSEDPSYRDNLLYIYTSGTTGMPKVAIIPNSRFMLVTSATYYMLGLKPSDIMYNPNPMYHMSGGVVGVCCALAKGIPSVVRPKFSVSAYWTDCIKYECTIAQYVGEMCRYLLTAPSRPEDSAHSVRLMVGNGMRPQIWREFVERFKIAQITEVYGSSEGNANIVNVDNKIGAVGCVPSILPKALHPVAIIRVNPDTHDPIRGPDGLCIRAAINEPGMFIGFIKQGNASREFSGYLDKEASKKKIIENVFYKGDKAFVTGDILAHDELGYYYFKDRVGDTFRWKGENVSTAEVEAIISNLVGYHNASVYGVQVPGTEGKAGMAAIANPENCLDLKVLAEGLDRALPPYARPIFLRVGKEIEITTTFKLKKINLQKEGFDPNKIQDKLYFRGNMKEYIELTPEIYQEIVSGSRKL